MPAGPDNLFPSKAPTKKCSHKVRLAFETAIDKEFDYLIPDELWPVQPGQRLEAPFGKNNKLTVGFCVETDPPESSSDYKLELKQINRVIDPEPLLDSQLLSLARWISEYYICPLGQVLTAMVPSAVKKQAGLKKRKLVYLNSQSASTIESIRGKKQRRIIELLRSKSATTPDTAAALDKLLEQADCTIAPLRKLEIADIIKICEKQILPDLPAIPEQMTIRTTGPIQLNEDQQKALEHFKTEIERNTFGVTLLYGVTDSGKTELYIRTIDFVIRRGKKAIVLLPEIALTAQTVQRFNERFEKIAVLHSALTPAQRNAQWQKIRNGRADVIIGARSAIFAPVTNLGLVVVDEEHEPGYKQDTAPRYHARDVAIKLAQLAGAHCILGSATPSLETLYNCRTRGYYHLVRLPRRILNLPMPQIELIDLRQADPPVNASNLISEPLRSALEEALAKKEQAILFLNRRGYSNFIFCPSCKHILHCNNCDVTLTFHKAPVRHSTSPTIMGKHLNYGYALCHYCLAQTLVPEKCPRCGKGMALIGFGTQRLEQELKAKFPHAQLARVDSDSMAGQDYYSVLRDFSLGKIDILIGTQMLAKGLHFPNVTVVGIINAETSLYLPDFRANERTFQLISQVAGRTGRSEKSGTVYLQTFLPDQPAIQFALKGDFEAFVQEELKHRRKCNLPPFWRMARIVLRDTTYDRLETAANFMRDIIDSIISNRSLTAMVRGPVPPVISRIQRYHRLQIIIQAPDAVTIQRLLQQLRFISIKPKVTVTIDMDPVSLL